MGIPSVLGQLTLWLLSNSRLEMLGSLVLNTEGGMLPQVQKNPGHQTYKLNFRGQGGVKPSDQSKVPFIYS